jgi:hypothetical protein
MALCGQWALRGNCRQKILPPQSKLHRLDYERLRHPISMSHF